MFFVSSLPSLYPNDIFYDSKPLTYETLYKEICGFGIKYPEVVFAQAVLESGNFKSDLCRNSNNLFGMKMPKRRETLAIGKRKSNYAIFNSWTDSVNDYLLWQNFVLERNDIQSKNDYLKYLHKVYAENKNYVSLLKKIMKDNQHLFTS